MDKPTFVVVANYNGRELLNECLNSLKAQSTKCHVVVVDNGSSDESQSLIKRDFPDVTLIELGRNLGFAGGVNAGIKEALKRGAKYVALFNNDARADQNWLSELMKAIQQNSRIGIATGRLLHYDGKRIDSTGDFYTIWGLPFPRGRNRVAKGKYVKQEEVFGATGGASLYRASLFDEIGLFDERFFAYYEDVDISIRARLAGWRVVYQPSARAYHRIGATSSQMGSFTTYHSIKNLFFLYHKNMPTSLFWKYYWRFLVTYLLMCAAALKRLQVRAILMAWISILLSVPSLHKDRSRIQAIAVINDKEFEKLLSNDRPPAVKKLLGKRE